jgi:hypothetical protein
LSGTNCHYCIGRLGNYHHVRKVEKVLQNLVQGHGFQDRLVHKHEAYVLDIRELDHSFSDVSMNQN